MHVFAFILAIVAILCFALAAFGVTTPREHPHNFVAWGLVALTLAWIVQLVVQSGSPIVMH